MIVHHVCFWQRITSIRTCDEIGMLNACVKQCVRYVRKPLQYMARTVRGGVGYTVWLPPKVGRTNSSLMSFIFAWEQFRSYHIVKLINRKENFEGVTLLHVIKQMTNMWPLGENFDRKKSSKFLRMNCRLPYNKN